MSSHPARIGSFEARAGLPTPAPTVTANTVPTAAKLTMKFTDPPHPRLGRQSSATRRSIQPRPMTQRGGQPEYPNAVQSGARPIDPGSLVVAAACALDVAFGSMIRTRPKSEPTRDASARAPSALACTRVGSATGPTARRLPPPRPASGPPPHTRRSAIGGESATMATSKFIEGHSHLPQCSSVAGLHRAARCVPQQRRWPSRYHERRAPAPAQAIGYAYGGMAPPPLHKRAPRGWRRTPESEPAESPGAAPPSPRGSPPSAAETWPPTRGRS